MSLFSHFTKIFPFENNLNPKRVWPWGPTILMVLPLVVLCLDPAQAYFICPQSDGSQLITDTPGPNCVKPKQPNLGDAAAGKTSKKSMEKKDPPFTEYIPAEQVDQNGHNKEWWRERIRELEKEKRAVAAKINDALKRLNLIPGYLPGIEQRRREHNILVELRGYRKELKEINRIIEEKLPEEARKAGAPSGWVRR